jgi:asparagine synthetase B (glutamine-hydrolysing)
MCGITGIFERNGRPVADPDLRRMTDAIAYRGAASRCRATKAATS